MRKQVNKNYSPAARTVSLLLVIVLAATMAGCRTDGKKEGNVVRSSRYIGQARGFLVTAEEAAQTTTEKLVSFAAGNKLNTIFLDTDAVAFADICGKAVGNKVQVFGVMKPDRLDEEGQKTAANTAAGLVKDCELAGIVLEVDLAGDTAAEQLVTAVAAQVQKVSRTTAVGVCFDGSKEALDAAGRLAGAGAVQLLLPRLQAGISDEEDSYLELLESWSTLEIGAAELYTLNTATGDRYELHNQLLANAMWGGVTGSVLAPYSYLAESSAEDTELLVSLLAAGGRKYIKTDLSFPQELAVSYPAPDTTLYQSSVYIMGTSDPAKPLLLDGEEVERIGSKGTFGVEVELEMGENSFSFSQEGSETRLTITRAQPAAGSGRITRITTPTLYPTTPLGVDSNEPVSLSVVGPAGASITATLNGTTVVMNQSKTAAAGTPVTFTTTISAGSCPEDQVVNAGSVTYVVTYDGGYEIQKSVGEVFIAGRNIPLVVEIEEGNYVASILTDLASDDNFTQSLKCGARVAVAGKSTATRGGSPVIAYRLPGGGYLLGNRVKIVEDAALCSSQITAIEKTEGSDWEQYDFLGGQPGVLAEQKDDVLTLRFLSTGLTADPAAIAGGIVAGVTSSETGDGFQLELTFAEGELWGYDITHGEEKTSLYLRRSPGGDKPFGKPLDGISVLLDPGHGGSDPGAMGVAGETGPTEAVLNMAVANAARFRLEQLGATVTMTRVDESLRVSLDERTFQAQQERPHIFLAIHHNSTALTRDLKDVRRMEAYYWENGSRGFADNLMKYLTETMARKPSDPENAYYYVTRLTFAPAVLFEMGFVVNPAEYEESCDDASLIRAANGIAMAVVDTVNGRYPQSQEAERETGPEQAS